MVLDSIKKMFGTSAPSSREIARNRLQMVLVYDRIGINPMVMKEME